MFLYSQINMNDASVFLNGVALSRPTSVRSIPCENPSICRGRTAFIEIYLTMHSRPTERLILSTVLPDSDTMCCGTGMSSDPDAVLRLRLFYFERSCNMISDISHPPAPALGSEQAAFSARIFVLRTALAEQAPEQAPCSEPSSAHTAPRESQ